MHKDPRDPPIHWNYIRLRARSHTAFTLHSRAHDHTTQYWRCVGDGLWTLSSGRSQFHGHGSCVSVLSGPPPSPHPLECGGRAAYMGTPPTDPQHGSTAADWWAGRTGPQGAPRIPPWSPAERLRILSRRQQPADCGRPVRHVSRIGSAPRSPGCPLCGDLHPHWLQVALLAARPARPCQEACKLVAGL